jgi:plastocyanin
MKKPVLLLAALALAFGRQIAPAADVTGKVTLKGTPPQEKVIDFTDSCGPMHTTPVTTRWYEAGKDGGLKDVFVYISKGCEGRKYPTPVEPVVLDQTACLYQPYVLGMMAGQPIKIKNSDDCGHNVHAVPTAAGGAESFNIPQIAGQENIKTFTHPEVLVKFECNVHNWMFAYVGVVSNPYYAVTDEKGEFKIRDLPPGEYTLTAYHLKAHGKTSAGVSKTIKVEGDKAVTADFTVEVPAAAAQ